MVRHEIPLLKRLALAALCTALPALGVATDTSLHIYGAVQHKLRLDLAALRQLPAQDNGKLMMVCQPGAQVDAEREHRGVRLNDALNQAGLDMPGHQDARRSYVVTRSSRDGYTVVFSWGKLYNSKIGDEILMTYQKNGLVLDPDEGPLALVSAGDLCSGPYHARWPNDLEVVHLPRGPLATP